MVEKEIREDSGPFTQMLSHYARVNERTNLFIFAVLGRTSSTALQRILNSSNEICILGETKGLIGLSLELLERMEETWKQFSHNYLALQQSMAQGQHFLTYPNALNVGGNIPFMRLMIANFLNPGIPVTRVGFKDIEVDSVESMERLYRFWPNSRSVFLFRNPIQQYESVRAKGYWPYSKDLDLFISRYVEVSSFYLQFATTHQDAIFVENTTIYEKKPLRALLRELEIQHYDESLVGDGVFSASDKIPLDPAGRAQIEESDAWQAYLTLKARAFPFVQDATLQEPL